MTVLVHYVQQPNQVFQFTTALTDVLGNQQSYTLTVTWNLYGQRYYLTCYTQQNVVVFCVPVMNSPDNYSINMAFGYFATPIVFRQSSQNFEIG
jgi:hypothetical protein